MATLDLESLKEYVKAPSPFVHAEDTVLLHVSHSNLRQRFTELRFDTHTTIERVKERLRTHTGTAVDSMHLQLYNESNQLIAELSDEKRMLGYYSPVDGYRIHLIDLDPGSLSAGGWLEDTSLVSKFELTDEEYSKRDGTFRKFKEQRLAADPTWTLQKEMASRQRKGTPAKEAVGDDYMADLAAHIRVGDRCKIDLGEKLGQVAYVGPVEGLAPGLWVGICYDEPVGKHDGMVKGRRYFQCPPNHGAVMRPDKLEVGDFPEVDPFADEDPDEI